MFTRFLSGFRLSRSFRSSPRRIACVLTLALAGLALPANATEIDLSKLSARPNPRLGLAFPGAQTRYYPLIAQAGIGVARLSVSWNRVEPSAGRFDWNGLDSRVKALQSLGIAPFLTFESDAPWATVPGHVGQVKNAQPLDFEYWSRFVSQVVERYDGDGRADMPGLRAPVRYWQFANEWIADDNRSGGWAGNTESLIAYIGAGRDAAKRADPNAIVVLGGIASLNADILLVARGGQSLTIRQRWNSGKMFEPTLAELRGPAVARIIDGRVLPVFRQARYDIADVHLYGPETRDEARVAMVRRLSGRPVLSSECGGPSLDYVGRYTPEEHFEAVIARNLAVLASGARFCLWFRLGEAGGATPGNSRTALYTSGAQPKPGVYAYRLLSRTLQPGTQVRRTSAQSFGLSGGGLRAEMGWGTAAKQLMTRARQAGAEAYCLADARSGRLSSDPSACPDGAFVVTGSGIATLLSTGK